MFTYPSLQELNRLKEALNRPSRQGSCTATSPTVTASSADPSSAPRFGGSEGGFSPQATFGSGSHFNSSSHFTKVSSPIYEIDLEADDNGGPTAAAGGDTDESTGKAAQDPVAGDGVGDGAGDSGLHGSSSDGSTPSRSRKSGRNMFAKAPGSTSHSRSGSSHGTPSSPSARSVATDRSDNNLDAAGSDAFSVLERAAAAAEAKVGVMSPTGRAVQAFANSSKDSGSGDACDGSVEGSVSGGAGGSGGSVDEPPSMPLLATDGGATQGPEVTRAAAVAAAAATALAMSQGGPTKYEANDGGGGGTASPAASPRGARAAPFGGALSGFACMAPQISPRAGRAQQISPRAGSRLPEIDEMDLGEDDHDVQGTGKEGAPESSSSTLLRPPPYPETSGDRRDRAGDGAAAASAAAPGMSLETAVAKSRSHTVTPDLMPIAELAENELFTDSETESEVSSRASSVSSSRSRRRAPRDPAALLAAALEKAGQVAAIPPPSAGSPGQVGRPLSAVQELPMEAVPLPGLVNPDSDNLFTHRQGAGGFRDGGCITVVSPPPPATQAPATPTAPADETAAPIPRPAQRPKGERSPSSGEGNENARLAGLKAGGPDAYPRCDLSPARSRQEEEDEEEEHQLWEKAMEDQANVRNAEGGAQELDSPSAAPAGALERAAAAAGAAGEPAGQSARVNAEAPKPPGFSLEAPKLPGFSLMGALTSLLGRKDKDDEVTAAPVVVAEEETEEPEGTVTINIPPGSMGSASDLTESPQSHTLELWPDAIVEKRSKSAKSSLDDGFVDAPLAAEVVAQLAKSSLDDGFAAAPMAEVVEKPPKSSLDDGFVDAPIPEVAVAVAVEEPEEPEEAAGLKLPDPMSSADLPSLVLPADEQGEICVRG